MVTTIQSTPQLMNLLSDTDTLFIQSDKILPNNFTPELQKACLERSLVFECAKYFHFTPNDYLVEALSRVFEPNFYLNLDEGLEKTNKVIFHGHSIDDIFFNYKDNDIFFLRNEDEQFASDKGHFCAKAPGFGIPILPYKIKRAEEDYSVISGMLTNQKVLVQETNKSGGGGNYLIRSEEDIKTLPEQKNLIATHYLEDDVIQGNASFFGWMTKHGLQVQYVVGQNTENLIYSGSYSPLDLKSQDKQQLRTIFKGISKYLQAEKHEGPVGFDLLKAYNQWHALDPNLRLTASFYPYYLGKRLGHDSWRTYEVDLQNASQEEIFAKLREPRPVGNVPYFMQNNLFLFLYEGLKQAN